MLSDFEDRENKYNDAAYVQEILFAELDQLDEGTDMYDKKVDRINELGKITGVFW